MRTVQKNPKNPTAGRPSHSGRQTLSLFEPTLVKNAVRDAFRKLHPRLVARNPVMFVVWVAVFSHPISG